MTRQAADTILVGELRLSAFGFTSPMLVPEELGLVPIGKYSISRRGFRGEYVVNEELVLETLFLNSRRIPQVGHILGERINYIAGLGHEYVIRGLALPLRYTGHILAGTKVISARQSWSILAYGGVVELSFSDGILVGMDSRDMAIDRLDPLNPRPRRAVGFLSDSYEFL